MDSYKLIWTRLQSRIFRLLCIKAGDPLSQRAIALSLNVSATAVSKAIKALAREGIILSNKDSKINLTYIQLNRDSRLAISLKRAENLRMIYETGLAEALEEKFPGSMIILFGSYSHGTDTTRSDIDMAVINSKEKSFEASKFEKVLGRKVNLQFYASLEDIHKNLRNSIINGITLKGVIEI